MKKNIRKFLLPGLALLLSLGLTAGCEGPAGTEGPQGLQGPIGPAGENGSVIHAGQSAPGDDLGNLGDYYLDLLTSELYGPKTQEDIWGEPIDLSGQNGVDGEDGSQIYAGTTAPDPSLGQTGDYYLNTATYDLYGPKTETWGTPINLKGNANVTLYRFDGNDFSTNGSITREIDDITETEMVESGWQVYLVFNNGGVFHIPGFGAFGFSEYGVAHSFDASSSIVSFSIAVLDSDPGEAYEEIRIVRTAAGNAIDNRTTAPGTVSPGMYNLDVSNYNTVAKYYGLNDNNTVRISSR